MFRSDDEIKAAGQRLLGLVDAHERGEISEQELLREWKCFMRDGYEYLDWLRSQLS